jgi:DNA-binding LacI/PurR family transcriptional regulator
MDRKGASSMDVAREAGVSQATVSYVLNNTPNIKIKPETRLAVYEAAKKLNYHTNVMARGMRLQKTECVGVVTRKNISSTSFMIVLEGIRKSLSERNYSINLCLSQTPEQGQEPDYIKYFKSKIIDGVIFVFTNLTDEEKRQLADNNVPYVMIYALADDDSPNLIKPDIDDAMSRAVKYLAENGKTEIGYLGRLTGNLGTRRFASFNKALEKHGVNINYNILHKIGNGEDEHEYEIDRFFAKQPRIPQALFCEGLSASMYLLRHASKHGIKIPEHMSVIIIATSLYSNRLSPSLSAIESPLFEMGELGVKTLFDQINGTTAAEPVNLEWSFVKRESC